MSVVAANIVTTVGEYQRDYIYKFILVSYPSSVGTADSSAAAFVSSADLYQQKGIWPNRKTNMINVKWGGENFWVAGIDDSTKTGQLIFLKDENGYVSNFFNACKDCTGDSDNQIATAKSSAVLSIGIARVDVTKSIIRDYRLLKNVQVSGVSESDPDKTGNGIVKVTVDICWDKNVPDTSQIGSTI